MESHGDSEEIDYSEAIDNLMNMFGNVMSKDVISAVVESCAGDLNLSVDAIMNITSDGNIISKEDDTPTATNSNKINMAPLQPVQPSTSYASAAQPAQNTGAIPKNIQRPTQIKQCFWTDQIRDIITNHNQGNRILILMRGIPGSGKTYLAKQLVDMIVGASFFNYNRHILSTDDFFMVRGQYQYQKYKLSEAHMWNQTRVRASTREGLSPIIVDNTNIEMWEMEPYLRDGVKHGYIIEVVEPTTPWAKKANQLFKRNSHNVPLVTIKRMLNNYSDNVTGGSLMRNYGLSYPANMVPPVKRALPPIPKEDSPVSKDKEPSPTAKINSQASTSTLDTNQMHINEKPEAQEEKSSAALKEIKEQDKSPINDFSGNNEYELTNEEKTKQKSFLEALKRLEEIEKVEEEWENGENWDADEQAAAPKNSKDTSEIPASAVTTLISASEAKPQRKANISPPVSILDSESKESIIPIINDCQDWSQISMFMPPWTSSSEPSPSVAKQEIEIVPIITKSNSTCMEIGDSDVNGKNKVMIASPRNINEFHISFDHEKIPQKRMLDKSSMTNEGIITESVRCSNEEKHFEAFRKLFKNIARSDLRDIFDKCFGDVNWAVDIVLDGVNNNQLKTVDTEELSDPEDDSIEMCECLANYNIIPDVAIDKKQIPPKVENLPVAAGDVTSVSQKKKREVTISPENIEIKRQIEQNVVIADQHYSEHCLKIRKMRRGEPDISEIDLEEASTSGAFAEAAPFECPVYSDDSDDDDDSCNVSEMGDDKIVTVTIGAPFIAELDERFGRKDMEYPAYIQPKISIPLSTLNEINALWMESLMFQLDEHAQKTAELVQQDEEFARQIAMKEEELSLAGKEPEVPDFKEIMDMDIALAMYQKDIAEWRNNMPTDLAAKMTRDKLYNLFPDVDKDTLLELLMAHDNNFKATVEVLLVSTGRGEVLATENGINKFVMAEEMKRKEEILQLKRKELSESDWPLLSKNKNVDMATVEGYREEANQHLSRRNLNYQKAQDCIRRGMTQVANYYSEIANFHKQKYEQANSLAVASLMQYHAMNNPDCTTIDLHYLRVKEAKESLDIFIDTHISKLRDAGHPRSTILFVITGRGKNSQGRARIKPATIHRLRERGLGSTVYMSWSDRKIDHFMKCYYMKNPGLLSARVNLNTKLTYQVSVP